MKACPAWEEYTRDCIRKGEIRGEIRGKKKSLIEVVKAMLSERLPIASIMKVTGKDYAICKIAEENGLVICQ